MKFHPTFDPGFQPLILTLRDYVRRAESGAHHTLTLVVERNNGYNYTYTLPISEDPAELPLTLRLSERLLKNLLWLIGGFRVYVCGDERVFAHLRDAYSATGPRAFDCEFVRSVYEHPLEILSVTPDRLPAPRSCSLSVGGHLDGCRIGFDAGGSDRKVSAVIDGETVYSEEVVWYPKLNSDPSYHYEGILEAMKTAASKMPRVDAIGVSSAGVYVDNRIMVASLFIKVGKQDYDAHVKNMYIDVAREVAPGAPLQVANDGDVTALAGAMSLGEGRVFGIAMGTSEAGGYINAEGGLNGWLTEPAFIPIDLNPDAAPADEWSGDVGCGVKYFSQDGVIKLAEAGGYRFEEGLSPAEKLKVIQKEMKEGNPLARTVYEDIGIYLGYALPQYALFYDIRHVLLLGRVTSGEGGEIIVAKAKEVLAAEFPELDFVPEMPDEKSRRVGQSIAAASLPESRR
ncbi:MAG: ROK family protein [Clostridia bacterium]|nr:ROK family protein [Clostridia bacterium]